MSGWVLLPGFIAASLGMLVFIRLGIYRQLLVFLVLLPIFPFAIKIGYGVANTTILALLPTVYLGAMLFCLFILGMQDRIIFRFSLLDLLVLSFFVLDFIYIFNPYLGALNDQRFLIIGLRGFQQRSLFGMAYFVIRWLNISPMRFDTIIRVLTYTTALGSVYALMQQLFMFDLLELAYRSEQIAMDPLMEGLYLSRAVGFFGSPFTFGLISAMGLVCGIYLLTSTPISKGERLFYNACSLLNGLAVIISGSRSTYFSLIIMCLFLFFTMRVPFAATILRSIIPVMTTIGILIAIFIIFSDSAPVAFSIERMISLSEVFAGAESITDTNFLIRRELISASWPMILSNPFGYGTGIFNGGSNPEGVVTVKGYSTFMDNEFVGIALELGVVGVLLFLTIVVVALQRAHMALRFPDWRSRAKILAALVVICPIAGVGGQWLAAYPANVLYWVVLGLIAGLPHPAYSMTRSSNA